MLLFMLVLHGRLSTRVPLSTPRPSGFGTFVDTRQSTWRAGFCSSSVI